MIKNNTQVCSLTFSPSTVWIDSMDKAELYFFTSLTLDTGITTCNRMTKYFDSWCLHSLQEDITVILHLHNLNWDVVAKVRIRLHLNASEHVTLVSLSSTDEWKDTWFSETKSLPWYGTSFCKAQVNAATETHTIWGREGGVSLIKVSQRQKRRLLNDLLKCFSSTFTSDHLANKVSGST